MANRSKRFLTGLAAIMLVLLPPSGYLGVQYLAGNFHTVEAGVLYRSGQLGPDTLRRVVAAEGIRTIVNLRGENPEEDWYVQEVRAADELGVRLVSIGISARSVPSTEKMFRIAEALRASPKPILVHCEGGSDRSGLAAAIFQIAVRDRSAAEAAEQLSIAYGHFPWLGSRTEAMDRALTHFASRWPVRSGTVTASNGAAPGRQR